METADKNGQHSRPSDQNSGAGYLAVPNREDILRQSIEDFTKFKEVYESHQNNEGHQDHFYGNMEYPCNMPVHQHYHTAEHPYDQGHYYPSHEQGHQMHHHGYEGHYHDNHMADTHHHFQNIYADRPYHTLGERGETEGGNVLEDMHFYHHRYESLPHGYHDNMPVQEPKGSHGYHKDPNFNSQNLDNSENVRKCEKNVKNSGGVSSGSSGRKLPQVTYRFQNISSDSQKSSQQTQSTDNNKKGAGKTVKDGKDKGSDIGYKVKYERDKGGVHKQQKEDEIMEKEFVEQSKALLDLIHISHANVDRGKTF